jgi:hypothetical protein
LVKKTNPACGGVLILEFETNTKSDVRPKIIFPEIVSEVKLRPYVKR